MQILITMLAVAVFGLSFLQCDKSGAMSISKNDKTKTAAVESPTPTVTPTDAPNGDHAAPRISLADAKADFDAGKAVIVDARGADSYKSEHIKGAINVPLSDFEANYKKIPTDQKIIVYCS